MPKKYIDFISNMYQKLFTITLQICYHTIQLNKYLKIKKSKGEIIIKNLTNTTAYETVQVNGKKEVA